jgi:DNA recombination protein RmuC
MNEWVGIGFVAGAATGAALIWLILRARTPARIAVAVNEALLPVQMELAVLRERSSRIPALDTEVLALQGERDAARNAHAALQASADAVHANLLSAREAVAVEQRAKTEALQDKNRLSQELAALNERFEAEKKNAEEKLALLEQAKEALSNQFKAIASDILEDKSKRFTEQNQANLNSILDPLRTRLREFQEKVEQVHADGGKERFALAQQVKQLVALNQSLSEDARNLTSALKGSAKSQGTWGELILERILESAGLQRGREYVAQEVRAGDDGKKLQPDVVIFLPEERHLVVDSKVSLVAYERCASSDLDDERAIALKQHLESIRNHVRSLSEKNYQSLYKLKSIDFVLMFVPIEPAFMLAIANDRDLFMEAWRRNVLLVSPSTLLFVVRTVAHLWRQEAQRRNVQEIAARGSELYDKLVGFVMELKKVGDGLKSAQNAYEQAEKKFCEGRGNVVRQAEMLRELGVKPTKRMPEPMLERSIADSISVLPVLDGGPPVTLDGREDEMAEPMPAVAP